MNQLSAFEVSTSLLVNLLYAYIGSCAFVGTLYTLFSRDPRLKPGAPGLLKILLIFCIGVVTEVLTIAFNIFKDGLISTLFSITFFCSLALFIVGWFGLFYVYYKSHVRIFHLSESVKLHNLSGFKWLRRFKKQEYEYEMKERELKDQLRPLSVEFSEKTKKEIAKGYSFLLTGSDEIRIMDTMFELIFNGLKTGETANYVCVNKHPIEIWEKLKHHIKDLNSHIKERIKDEFILIDAYTPNFGFDDEINEKKLRELRREGIKVVTGKTIPGIHSATKRAFNLTKQKEREKKREVRRPNIMIYDSLSTLSHVSSIEGIQLFLSHMIPAEKNYQMWTFVIEHSDCEKAILRTVKKLVDSIFEFNIEKKDEPPENRKLRIHTKERKAQTQKRDVK